MSTNLNQHELKKLFNVFDNGNGVLSLAEIQAAIKGHYPHLVKHKKAIMRAYKIADTSGNGYIEFKEFAALISLLNHYDKIKDLFHELDTNNDHRISFDEFRKGYDLLGQNSTNISQLRTEFDSIDTNHSGYIVYDEFCIYMAERMG